GHGERVVQAHRRARAHDQHESVRYHVLLAGGTSREPRHHRPRDPHPAVRLLLLGRAAGRSRGASRDRVLVLAFRRRRVGRGVHRRVRGGPMTPGGEDRAGGPVLDRIESPAPTAWPMVLAFGVTLIFGGLVTNQIVSALGLVLALVAAVGWWRQVLPV